MGRLAFDSLGAGRRVHQRNEDVEAADGYANFARRVCAEGKAVERVDDLASCDQELAGNRASWLTHSWGNVAVSALVPIPFGWLIAFILLHTGRAQVAGFRAVVPWKTLPATKKAFVTFSGATAIAGLLFGSMVVMNLYVDSAAPVSLGLKAMINKGGDDYVQASGTWTRSGTTPGSTMGAPLQTSEIVCNRIERRCSESRASVDGHLLIADLIEHEVERWDSAVIVFKAESECAVERFTIDMASESVNGVGQSDQCRRPALQVQGRERKALDISPLRRFSRVLGYSVKGPAATAQAASNAVWQLRTDQPGSRYPRPMTLSVGRKPRKGRFLDGRSFQQVRP